MTLNVTFFIELLNYFLLEIICTVHIDLDLTSSDRPVTSLSTNKVIYDQMKIHGRTPVIIFNHHTRSGRWTSAKPRLSLKGSSDTYLMLNMKWLLHRSNFLVIHRLQDRSEFTHLLFNIYLRNFEYHFDGSLKSIL